MDSRPNLNDDPVQYVLHEMWAALTRKGSVDAIYAIRECLAHGQYADALAFAIAIELDRANRDAPSTHLAAFERAVFAIQHAGDSREIPVKDSPPPAPVVITTADIDAAFTEPKFKQPPRIPPPRKIR